MMAGFSLTAGEGLPLGLEFDSRPCHMPDKLEAVAIKIELPTAISMDKESYSLCVFIAELLFSSLKFLDD